MNTEEKSLEQAGVINSRLTAYRGKERLEVFSKCPTVGVGHVVLFEC